MTQFVDKGNNLKSICDKNIDDYCLDFYELKFSVRKSPFQKIGQSNSLSFLRSSFLFLLITQVGSEDSGCELFIDPQVILSLLVENVIQKNVFDFLVSRDLKQSTT